MIILIIEPSVEVRELYKSFFTSQRHRVDFLTQISYELDASKYDVVIVGDDVTKHYVTNIRYDHLVVAASTPTAKRDGCWAITRPFYMGELAEIIDSIAYDDPKELAWEGVKLQ